MVNRQEMAENGPKMCQKCAENNRNWSKMGQSGPATVPKMTENMPKMVENADSGINGSARLSNLGHTSFWGGFASRKEVCLASSKLHVPEKTFVCRFCPAGSGSMDALVTGPAATDASNWGRVVNDDCPCIAVSHTFGFFLGCPR